jgi:hypothetical protein
MKKAIQCAIILSLVLIQFKTKAQFCFNITPTNPANSIGCYSFGTADFNNDTRPDFIITSGSNLYVNLQQTNGVLDSIILVDSATFAKTSCIADFNNDGNADIATHDYGPGEFLIYIGNGNGTFQTALTRSSGLFNVNNTICCADFNADGKADLAISTGFNLVKVLLGNGDGTFGNYLSSVTTTTVSGQLLCADINADGKPDLATPSLVMYGDGLGGFSTGTFLNGPYYPICLTVADFNNDSVLDIATLNWGTSPVTAGFTGIVTVFLGDGLNGFALPTYFSIGDSTIPLNNNHNMLVNADFDGDGNIDLAMGTYTTTNGTFEGKITLLRGDGLGSFSLPVNYPAVVTPQGILAVDVNQDGKKDIATMAQFGGFSGFNKLIIMYNCSPTALTENTKNIAVKLFPNPGHGLINIQSENEIEKLTVVDILGREIYTSIPLAKDIKVQLADKGVYLIKIETSEGVHFQKIIVD